MQVAVDIQDQELLRDAQLLAALPDDAREAILGPLGNHLFIQLRDAFGLDSAMAVISQVRMFPGSIKVDATIRIPARDCAGLIRLLTAPDVQLQTWLKNFVAVTLRDRRSAEFIKHMDISVSRTPNVRYSR